VEKWSAMGTLPDLEQQYNTAKKNFVLTKRWGTGVFPAPGTAFCAGKTAAAASERRQKCAQDKDRDARDKDDCLGRRAASRASAGRKTAENREKADPARGEKDKKICFPQLLDSYRLPGELLK